MDGNGINFTEITLTSSVTILGGILIFVLGEIIQKFFIEPVHELRRLRGDIADVLIFYADKYSNPSVISEDNRKEIRKVMRNKASLLMSKMHLIPVYSIFALVGVVPKESNIREAHRNLIGISNLDRNSDSSSLLSNVKNIESMLGLNLELNYL